MAPETNAIQEKIQWHVKRCDYHYRRAEQQRLNPEQCEAHIERLRLHKRALLRILHTTD